MRAVIISSRMGTNLRDLLEFPVWSVGYTLEQFIFSLSCNLLLRLSNDLFPIVSSPEFCTPSHSSLLRVLNDQHTVNFLDYILLRVLNDLHSGPLMVGREDDRILRQKYRCRDCSKEGWKKEN